MGMFADIVGFELFFALLLVCFIAEFAGMSLLQDSAAAACCEPVPDLPFPPPNSTANATDCFVVWSMHLQERVLVSSTLLLALVYCMVSAYLVNHSVIVSYPRWVTKMWQALVFLGHARLIPLVSLTAVGMVALGLGVALSLSRTSCVADTSVWDLYVQYMGLLVFNFTCTILLLFYVQYRCWCTVTAKKSYTHATFFARPVKRAAATTELGAPLTSSPQEADEFDEIAARSENRKQVFTNLT